MEKDINKIKNEEIRKQLVNLYLVAEKFANNEEFFKINEYFTNISSYIEYLEDSNDDLKSLIERIRIEKYINKC